MDKELLEYLQGMESRIQGQMNEGFNSVNERLDKVETRLDKVEDEVKKNSVKLESLDESIQKLEAEVGELKYNLIENTLVLTEVEARTRYTKEMNKHYNKKFENLQKVQITHTSQIAELQNKVEI